MSDLFILLQIEDVIPNGGLLALQKISIKLFGRLIIDLIAALLLARAIYQRYNKNSALYFTFIMFNVCIFFVCFLLNKVEISMGAAFGLFAVFSMLRYRTEDISIKDMTYIFLFIALGLLNAIAKIKGAGPAYEYILLFVLNSLILLIAALLESNILFTHEQVRTISYAHPEFLHENKKNELMQDLKNKTGLSITRFKITKMDLDIASAQIKVYYTLGKS